MEILNVKDLTFTYPGNAKPAVENINLRLCEGDFAILCGETGSGKSTLLRLLKEELRPLGDLHGDITYMKDGLRIGFVMQNPNEQTVTDKVWHELVFGMENLGYPQSRMASRAAEMAEYFGISDWYDKNVNELSGGQLQLLNLASVMVTDPDILILDEPTAQLDPVSTSDFFGTLRKLNRDFAVTVLIAEHRLEELLQDTDRLLVMEKGNLITDGYVKDVIKDIGIDSALFDALPVSYRLYRSLENAHSLPTGSVPLTIREGRELVRKLVEQNKTGPTKNSSPDNTGLSGRKEALTINHAYFRYDRYSPDVLKCFDLTVYCDEIFCILGGNASGKTTALNLAAGLAVPYSGSVKIFSKKIREYKNESLYRECVAMLPQDVQTLFMCNTVREELKSMDKASEIARITELLKPVCDLNLLMDKHPYDLSGGEQQIAGFAKVLAAKPKLLLADEPTKGMDAGKKRVFADVLKKLKTEGLTIVTVTHDAEFAALCADRCALCFRGEIVSYGMPEEFFGNNSFYTTSVSRVTRGMMNGVFTLDDAVRRLS